MGILCSIFAYNVEGLAKKYTSQSRLKRNQIHIFLTQGENVVVTKVIIDCQPNNDNKENTLEIVFFIDSLAETFISSPKLSTTNIFFSRHLEVSNHLNVFVMTVCV